MESAKDVLREVSDSRLLIENVPKVGLDGEAMIGYSPEQVMELMEVCGAGLCLDFGHAVKAAVSLGVDYKEYIKRFMQLEPRMFHISDGRLDYEKDEHLPLGEGDYDISFMRQCVEDSLSKMVTFETPRDIGYGFKDDVRNLNRFFSFSNQWYSLEE